MRPAGLSLGLSLGLLVAGCGSQSPASSSGTGPGPDGGAACGIDCAAAKYPDLRTLWTRSIARTCGPNNGVCHNSRQSPDMQTAEGLLASIGQRCNQIRDQPSSIDNLCEPPGDELTIDGASAMAPKFAARIGDVTADSPSAPTALTVTLHDKLPSDLKVGAGSAIAVVRQIAGLAPVSLAIPASAVKVAAGGAGALTLDYAVLNSKAAPGPKGETMAQFLSPSSYTPGDAGQVELGDPNGDGVFGANLGGALIKPGDPLKSYLMLRVLGPLPSGDPSNPACKNTSVAPPMSTEVQMPIANFQYWDIDNDAVALWCWIAGMKSDGSDADGPIDFARCDTSKMPMLTHQGGEATTFSEIYAKILQPSCSSCHHQHPTQPTTLYMDSLGETYDVLLGVQGAGPSETAGKLPYVTRTDPTQSYLYLKMTGDPKVSGAKMPLGGDLPQATLDSIKTWIAQGANNN